MKVNYYVKAPSTRQNEVIRIFLKTFNGYTHDIARCTFPTNSFIHCYVYLNDKRNTVQLVILDKPLVRPKTDLELVIYQDIATIPLINVGIAEHKAQSK